MARYESPWPTRKRDPYSSRSGTDVVVVVVVVVGPDVVVVVVCNRRELANNETL